MALISCHALNSVYGTNAAGIGVRLVKTGTENQELFAVNASNEGRIKETVTGVTDAEYELIFATGKFLANESLLGKSVTIVPEVVIRFQMPDPDAHYHFSLAFTPGSFSTVIVVQK